MKESERSFNAKFLEDDSGIKAKFGEVIKAKTGDYEELNNLPSINGVELMKDKSFEDLGVETLKNSEILEIFNRVFGGN